jgi:non-ribosomal peptide synthetase component F
VGGVGCASVSAGGAKGGGSGRGAVRGGVGAFCNTFPIDNNEIIGNQTPFFFDASAKDIYLMMKTGATLDIIPIELFAMPTMLIEYLNKKSITYLSWVPTAIAIVSQLSTFDFIIPTTIRRVFFVGEVMPMKHLNYWRRNLPNVQFVNLYGSSEIAGICCFYEVNREFADDATLPMGKPLENCHVYLLDSESKLINKPNVTGEVFIASKALALEYFHDPKKTVASFMQHDFGSGMERCFKTGDLAQYDSDGNLLFVSRIDFQIKHLGHRIELGEIEAVAGALPEIVRCAALYDFNKKRIILFCETSSQEISARAIQSILRNKLSSYMVPNKIVLGVLPLNPNGKIDRAKLKSEI